jgi:hypothetical protein
LDISSTVNNLTVASGNVLNQNNGVSLTVYGNISNDGNININSSGNNTDLILDGSVTLSGAGTLTLSNNGANRIYSGIGSTASFTNQETIQGAGQFGFDNSGYAFTLDNQGTIDANVSSTLQVSPSNTMTNTGTLEATSGGNLYLFDDTITNTGGLILSSGAGSTVTLSSTEVDGGTLTTTAGGLLQTNTSNMLNGVTVSTGSTLTLTNGTATVLEGTITNNGTIAQSSSGNNTDVEISGAVVLSGTGSLNLSNSPYNRIYGIGTPSSDSLVVNQVIQGSGQFGINNGGYAFSLTNNSTIDANQSNALSISPGYAVTNNGTLEATSGGTLALVDNTYNNAVAGLILASGAGSTVSLNGATINGGTLTTTGGGVLENTAISTLNGVTLSSGSTLTLLNGTATTLEGTFTNNGTIALNSTGNFTDIQLNGAIVLTGTGSLNMTNSPYNRIYGVGTVASDSLTNDQVIQGAGQIGIDNGGYYFALTNNGTIDANQSGGTLQISPSITVANNGLLEATNGGTLYLYDDTYTNSGHTILASGPGSTVNVNVATINGGTLTTTGGGAFQNTGTATFSGVTLSTGSTLTLLNGTTTTLEGTITNNGTIAQGSTGNFTDIYINGAGTLTGTGSLNMSNSPYNRIYGVGTLASDSLTNYQLIQGSGQVGINNGGYSFALDNEGTIDANQSAALMVSPSDAVLNNGILEATVGGTLNLYDNVFNNANGLILASGAGSTVNLAYSTINGGTLTTTAGGAMYNGQAATLNGVTLSTGSTVTLLDNTYTTLEGTITDNGSILQNGAGNFTDVYINGPVTLAGNGSYTMSNSPYNRVYGVGDVSLDVLTNGANHTIQGAGQLGINNGGYNFTLLNQGTIIANQSNTLFVAPGTITNTGTLQVNSGSLMHLQGPSGSFTNFSGSTLAGGSYVMNNGTLQIDQLGNTGKEIQTLGDGTQPTSVVLNGASAAVVDSGGYNALSLFTVNANASLTLENGANMATPANLENFGSIKVGTAGDTSTLTIGSQGFAFIPNGIGVNPEQTAYTLYNQSGGIVSGGGTIAGIVNNAGTITASDPGSPDILTINGDYTQGSTGTLEAFLGGSAPGTGYSELLVHGNASLGGTLDVSLIGGFTPTSGENFYLLESTANLVTGTFAALDLPTLPAGESWDVTYNPSGCPAEGCVDLTFEGAPTTTPEPSIFLLLAAGIGMMALLRKYRNTAGREMA